MSDTYAGYTLAVGLMTLLVQNGVLTPDEVVEMLDEHIENAQDAVTAQLLTHVRESFFTDQSH